jgi:hypothetical protein
MANLDPVIGFIILLISVIIITIVKIIETVRKIKRTAISHERDENSLSESNFIIEKKYVFIPVPDSINSENHSPEDYGIELSTLPENTSVTFNEVPVEPPKIFPENISFNDPFSLIQAELRQDVNVQNFTLFTNPQHIFSGALKEIFAKKIALILNHLEDYKFKVYPLYKIQDSKIIRLHLDEQKNILIEEIFELWRMGYSHPALPELFVHYFFAIKSEQASLILKSIMLHNQLEKTSLNRICFLYQDIFCKKISFSDVQELLPLKITDAFDLANIIINKNIYVTRKKWRNWEETIFNDLHEDRKGIFYLFYNEFLAKRTSPILYYTLIEKFKHILHDQWRDFIERQAFYHGHYDKLNRLSFIPPEYTFLISKNAAESTHIVKDSLSLLKNKPFVELHTFLIYSINHSTELESYEINYDTLNKYMHNLDILHHEKNYIPQAIRFILYLYFYEKKDIQKLNYIMPYIHGRIGGFIPRLYQTRLLFKNKEYEKAWHEINDLWNNDEENMILMNETAVYAWHSGRLKEAEEIFSRLRKLYAQNVQILHNEAVFLQHKARLIGENRKFHDDYFVTNKDNLRSRKLHPATY